MIPSGDFGAKVLSTIERWGMLPPGTHVGIAVSGGADSVALFRTLHSLAAQRNWRLVVLHVNHKLRGADSEQDAAFVEGLANQHVTEFRSAELPISGAGNLEQEARIVRCAWLKQCTIMHNLHKVALGHTRSDQAETVLFRLLRGAGSAGLAAIRPVTSDGFVRPLLGVGRDEVRAQLGTIGQSWREDSSNRDLRFDRNRIRLELLPLLARDWNPAIESALNHTADWALAEEEYWKDVVSALAREHLVVYRDAVILPDIARANGLPEAALRRLLRRAIELVRGNLRSVDFGHVDRIRALLRQTEGSGRLQIPGVDVLRSFDQLRFAAPGNYSGARDWAVPISVPDQISLPCNNITLTLRLEGVDNLYNETGNWLDADQVSGLVLRTWQPGDRYRPVGSSAAVKLKTLFQESRIPLWERRTWPVLVQNPGEVIVWTRNFGVAEGFAPHGGASVAVLIEERENFHAIAFPKPESGTGRLTSIEAETE